MRSSFLACCVFVALLVGCTEIRSVDTRTQVTLRILSQDAALNAQMTQLHIALRRKDADWVPASSATIPRERIKFPLDVPIFPSSRDAIDKPFEVVVDVLADGVRISQARVIAAYALNTLRILPLALYPCAHADGRACSTDDCHGERCLTCGASGGCDAVTVADPEQLEVSVVDSGVERPDGATRTAQPDGATRTEQPDGATTPQPEAGSRLPIGAAPDSGMQPGRLDPGNVLGQCIKSAEICDGSDNDCDGKADNGAGMLCVRDERGSCSFSNGSCSVTGARQCNSICGWGACMPPAEALCDRKDDNCDGNVDEQLLKVNSGSPLASFEGELADTSLAQAPTSSAAAGGYFAVYRSGGGTKGKLEGVRIALDGKLIGSPILIDSEAGQRAKVVWGGSAWVVVYMGPAPASGYAPGVTSVTVDPSSGTLGSKRVLSPTGAATELVVAHSNPPIAVWTEEGGLFATNLSSQSAAVITLAPIQTVVTTVRYGRLALTAVDDGKGWALWAGGGKRDALNTVTTYPLYYMALDKDLRVTTNKLLFETTQDQYGTALWYVAQTQTIMGYIYPSFHGSHALDGSGFVRADGGGWGIVARDASGYASLSTGALSRFSFSGEMVDSYQPPGFDPFGDFITSYDLVQPSGDGAVRYAVVGGYKGGLRFFTVGCK